MDPETTSATALGPQGIGADLLATLEGFSREDVDAFALTSQQRASQAQRSGLFERSVVPVRDALGQVILGQDEFIKPSTTLEGLASLKPAFEQMGAMGFDQVALTRYPQVERIHHVHHAGNSSGIVDGAAAVLIGSEAAGREHGLTPRARIVSAALSGSDTTLVLTRPMPPTLKAPQRSGMPGDQVDLVVMNESFAVVVTRFCNEH